MQVELPANTKIEYKYVILEEQVGQGFKQMPVVCCLDIS